MNATQGHGQSLPEPSRIPEQGWHCSHFFYRFRRDVLSGIDQQGLLRGRDDFIAALQPPETERPERLQGYTISGHRADFGIVVMDPDPLKVEGVNQSILGGVLGPAIEATWSFVSMSEVSEYVPTVEQFRDRLAGQGVDPQSPEMEAKLNAYRQRLPMMNRQRLSPEFPDWPAACFYPMSKSRVVGANWFIEPFSRRQAMMAEHAQSGISFAGRVTQLVTVGLGLDDWEWMVTLWGRNPQYLKDIVYRMRFDEASARYGLFGPFYLGYRATAEEILTQCMVVRP